MTISGVSRREESKLEFGEFTEAYFVLLTRAWISEEYVAELLADPSPALREAGFEVPPGIDVEVIRHSDGEGDLEWWFATKLGKLILSGSVRCGSRALLLDQLGCTFPNLSRFILENSWRLSWKPCQAGLLTAARAVRAVPALPSQEKRSSRESWM